jgi:hypothetical protein
VSFQDWLSNGWLVGHQTSPQEIFDLLAVADRDMKDSQTPGLSSDWRLNIAYNAALQTATAALAACGYRAARDAHHYRIIQSLAYTIGASPDLVAQFDQFRKKRNIGAYDRAGATSDQEALEMNLLAQRLRSGIEDWLRINHPSLLE